MIVVLSVLLAKYGTTIFYELALIDNMNIYIYKKIFIFGA